MKRRFRKHCLLLAVVLASTTQAWAQAPALTTGQIHDFLLTAEIISAEQTDKGTTQPWRLTLSDGTLTHDAHFQSVDRDEDDGMYVVRGRLDPEAGAALVKALEAGGELLYDEEKERQAAPNDVTPTQRRADAMGRVAEAALAGGLDQGTRGDRFQVVVHVDAATLTDAAAYGSFRPGLGLDASSISAIEGRDVPAGTSQRIACDASRVVMTHDDDGRILDVGRKTRVVSPALRRALVARDKECQFPGCDRKYCDAHHLQHWAYGGATSLENLA